MDNIRNILKSDNFVMKKKFGQNFLTDENLLSDIVLDAGVQRDDTVIEIGAGAGTLTRELCKRAKRVVAFEIDRSLKGTLSRTLDGIDNVEVIFEDILKTDKSRIARMADEFKVVANLPYYITTPVLFYFLESDLNVKSMTVTVQKEVAERMVAKCDTPEYGVLSLSVQSRGRAVQTRTVDRSKFFPTPNVDSAVVRIDVSDGVYSPELFRLFRAAFAMRRKTLVNNLMASFGLDRERAERAVCALGVDVRTRGEALSLEQFVALNKILKES